MSEHTPGPWNVWKFTNFDKCIIVGEPRCSIDNDDVDHAQAAANARLIAAAPDLLEALKHSLAGHYATWMAARAEVEGGRTSHDLFQKEPEVIEAYAAIAKATGQGSGV